MKPLFRWNLATSKLNFFHIKYSFLARLVHDFTFEKLNDNT